MRISRPRSLPEVHGSVTVPRHGSFLRRLLSFSGPAFLVSVGYMDPGNWATDLAAGSQFGYKLIWVILLSNMIAILLQALSARLGIVTGRDLAQACRDHYPPALSFVLWILAEVAIAACDLAEVLGSAIGMKLLFGIPILVGVVITGFDVLLLLALQSYGIRRLEALIITLVATIGVCFGIEMILSKPPIAELLAGFIPSLPANHPSMPHLPSALYISIGIIGATVMPHNLYLHSALVQSRAVEPNASGVREAAKFSLFDSVIALNGAFFVNAAILVLAAAAFYANGLHDVASLEHAHELLAPLLGTTIAPIAFAVALLAAGQSSTITGTLAGQIVMEGFVSIRLRPWLRRLITRALAIVPAVLVIWWYGEGSVDALLVFSQVILSMQLAFAIVPLIQFVSSKRWMGPFAARWWVLVPAWASAAVIIGLNGQLVIEELRTGLDEGHAWARFVLLPITILLVPVLVWIIGEPFWRTRRVRPVARTETPILPAEGETLAKQYRRIGIALDASRYDQGVLKGVLPLLRGTGAEVVLIHVVESAVARFLGSAAHDEEARHDADYLERVANELRNAGFTCRARLGAGEPEDEIARIGDEEQLDLIVVGGHGHRLLGDLFHGSTVSELRHRTTIPLLSIRVEAK